MDRTVNAAPETTTPKVGEGEAEHDQMIGLISPHDYARGYADGIEAAAKCVEARTTYRLGIDYAEYNCGIADSVAAIRRLGSAPKP